MEAAEAEVDALSVTKTLYSAMELSREMVGPYVRALKAGVKALAPNQQQVPLSIVGPSDAAGSGPYV